MERVRSRAEKASNGEGEYPVLSVITKDALSRVLQAARSWLDIDKELQSDAKMQRYINRINKIAADTDTVDAPEWRISKALAQKMITLEPERIYRGTGTLLAFKCPSCHKLTITDWGTDYYHCSKCGQKVQTYDVEGMEGLTWEH